MLLNARGAMSYTELMEELGIVSTGLLNYHLKVLSDLLSKTETGHYSLTEKGKLASRLLTEFPDDYQLERKKWHRRLWTAVAVSQIMILVAVLTLHAFGYMDLAGAVRSVIAAVSGVALAYFGYRMTRTVPIPGSSKEKKRMKIGYMLGGAWLGFAAGFFGTILLSMLSAQLGGPNILRLIDSAPKFALVIGIPTVLGTVGGYYLGKRNDFRKPKWATWLDEKFGFT